MKESQRKDEYIEFQTVFISKSGGAPSIKFVHLFFSDLIFNLLSLLRFSEVFLFAGLFETEPNSAV